MSRRLALSSLLVAAVIALPVSGISLVAADAAAAKKHHRHHKHHHKKKHKKGGPCGGLAVGGTDPNTNASVQFNCTETFSSFTVTTNKTVVATMEGSQPLPFVLYTGGKADCTVNGPHSFSCTVPSQPPGTDVKAFYREQESCVGMQVSVTVNGKSGRIPVNGACK